MTFTYDENIFSDIYKDAHGFRPRGHEFYATETTPARKQELWDQVILQADEEIERFQEEQKHAVVEFESHIESLIKMGAKTRQKAIEWIVDGCCEDLGYNDTGFVEYSYNLPYGYLTSK